MSSPIARRKCKVHALTTLAEEVFKMARWCDKPFVIARTVGCSTDHAELLLKMKKSTAHVFLPIESYNALYRK